MDPDKNTENTGTPISEGVEPEPVDIEENVMKEQRADAAEREALLAAQQAFENIPAGALHGVGPDVLAAARARVAAALGAQGIPQPAENLVEGGPLGWNAPPILPWSKEVDAPIAETRRQLALYFPDWGVAVWPTAVPSEVIEALKADTARPENERLVELSKLHTIQIECTWMPDMTVQRRMAQGATLEEVKGPKVYQFIAPPFTCQGPPVLEELMKHIGSALLEQGARQRDPAEVLAERKQAEIDEALRVLRENGVPVMGGPGDGGAGGGGAAAGVSSGPAPKEPEPMTLERWETMSEPAKMQWQKEWAAWEAYRSPGPPPVDDRPPVMHVASWERIAPPGAPFVPPDAYVPGRAQVPPRGRPRGLHGPNGSMPWEVATYEYREPGVPEQEHSDPEVAMIEHLLGLFQGWGRADVERVLSYVKARLTG